MKTQKEVLAWAIDRHNDVWNLAHRVYSRPPGETGQEIAGLAITLAGLVECAGYDIDRAVAREWERLSGLSPGYLKAKHDAKVAEGLALP
jgi:hypothetical protein